jgi:hypothetical protein
MSAWSMFFSFDVMGEVGFGKDFNNLTSGVEQGGAFSHDYAGYNEHCAVAAECAWVHSRCRRWVL